MEPNELDNFEPVARIIVIGVGGAGNNAVNRMIDENISSVEFYVANTDKQALSTSKAPNRLVLGNDTFKGLGAGGNPAVGESAALQSEDEIRQIVRGADMVFIAAGMGGGTGTGASPVIARIAREEGALAIAIVTRPFGFEGKKRISQSVEGLNALKEQVDSIIVVSNDKLLMMNGQCPISEAFQESDKVLAQSVKTVTDLILMPAVINLDFADVSNTLRNAGIALIGIGMGSGPKKAEEAARAAISSPLLEVSIQGARSAIISVTCGSNVSLYEAQDAANKIVEACGGNLDMKFGVSINPELADQMLVSVIATDFAEEYDFTTVPAYDMAKVRSLSETPKEEIQEEEENDDAILPNFLKENRF